MTQTPPLKVVIAGSGSIGCYVGGMLASGGADVHFFARERIAKDITKNGLKLSDWTGRSESLTPQQFNVSLEKDIFKGADLILVCVKSKDTAEMAQTIKDSGNTTASIFSLQNGVANTQEIRQVLPHHTVLTVMVPYNVVYQNGGIFHCGTEGALYCQDHEKAKPLQALAEQANLGLELKEDMASILWGKLLLNLNNPINALSGIPLKQQLETAGFRKIFKKSMQEGLQVLKAAGIAPGQVAAIPMFLVPTFLSLPDWIFTRVAHKMLSMDPKARSSMWEDLQSRRPVEVDYINGEIVKLGEQFKVPTPMNKRLIKMVKKAQVRGEGSPNLAAEQILNQAN